VPLAIASKRTRQPHVGARRRGCSYVRDRPSGLPGHAMVLPGHLRETLGHCARRAQRHVHLAVPADGEPAGDHRAMVAHPKVVGMRDGARAFTGSLRPASHGAPGFPYCPHGRVAGELLKRLGCHRRGSFCPFGGYRRGGLPGSEELPSWAISGGTHLCIVSPGQAGGQPSSDATARRAGIAQDCWTFRPICGGMKR
jgi:hypothetical protein